MTSDVDDWFEEMPASRYAHLNRLRRLVLETDARLIEELKWNRPVYAINGLICYLQATKKHAVLGFQQGAHIADPAALLVGTGKHMRHIKIPYSDVIDIPACRTMVEAAITFDVEQVG